MTSTDQPEPPRNPLAPATSPPPATTPSPPGGWEAPTPPSSVAPSNPIPSPAPAVPQPMPHPAPGRPAPPYPATAYADAPSTPVSSPTDDSGVPPPFRPAPLGRRFVAWAIDQLVFVASLATVGTAIWVPIATGIDWEPFECAESTSGFCERTTTGSNVLIGAGVVLSLLFAAVLGWWYFVRRVTRTGATLGKSLIGLRIVDEATGRPPTTTKAFVRWLVADLVSSRVLYLGYLWAFVDDGRRTWHDRSADTVVIDD